MYYIFVTNGEVNGYGCCQCVGEGWLSIEATKEMCDNIETYGNYYYLFENGELIVNPNYEQEQAQKEYERVGELTMTALDFITFLRTCGLSLETIRNYLNDNIELDTQLKYCQNVYFKVVREILPITVGEITITKEMAEAAFKTKNGEMELLDENEIPF